MAQDGRRNPLALAVLTCLLEKPMHPYEMAQTLRYRAKHESIRLNYGSLYNVVDSLERRRLIEARETRREGRRPERTIYEITDRGKREMSDWLSELLAVPTKEYLQFQAALSLIAALPPDEVIDLLQRRRDSLEVRLGQLRGVAETLLVQKIPRLFTLEAEYEEALLQAEMAWIDQLVEELRAGSLDGLEEWQSWFRDGTRVWDQADDPEPDDPEQADAAEQADGSRKEVADPER